MSPLAIRMMVLKMVTACENALSKSAQLIGTLTVLLKVRDSENYQWEVGEKLMVDFVNMLKLLPLQLLLEQDLKRNEQPS